MFAKAGLVIKIERLSEDESVLICEFKKILAYGPLWRNLFNKNLDLLEQRTFRELSAPHESVSQNYVGEPVGDASTQSHSPEKSDGGKAQDQQTPLSDDDSLSQAAKPNTETVFQAWFGTPFKTATTIAGFACIGGLAFYFIGSGFGKPEIEGKNPDQIRSFFSSVSNTVFQKCAGNEDLFEKKCKNKTTVLIGKISGGPGDMTIRTEEGNHKFNLDFYDASHEDKIKDGDIVELGVRLVDEDGTFLDGSADWAYVLRSNAEVRASLCKYSYSSCRNNSDLVNNWEKMSTVRVACQMAAEKNAKYGSPDWPWVAFGNYAEGNDYAKEHQIRLQDNEVKFQNGFGAMVKTSVKCFYDLRTQKADVLF
ncbi:MAG: hypothetical protein O2794_04470 [bacterium]|nr:hypothetical protein [bacterium]